ncbi:MAG: M48 family metallopeptidase [Candidatus Limivicinus sp.]|jgi:predicted metal-dependent hydrolase
MHDEKIKPEIIRSSRKTMSLQVTAEGRIILRCPGWLPASEIDSFLRSKAGWIEKTLKEQECRPKHPPYSPEELKKLTEGARQLLPWRVKLYAEKIAVDYGKISVRKQRSIWGSCSSSGNLSFNCLLMLCPPSVQDYIVVHELCHRKEMNHSKRFWAEVEKVLPDYRESRKWLKEYGSSLIAGLMQQ